MIEKIIVVAPTTAVPIRYRFRSGFKCIARTVVFFEQMLGAFKAWCETKFGLNLLVDVGHFLDE